MGKRPRRTDLDGLIVIDKPLGCTSMDVVRRVRHHAGGAKTGHAGTLDPLATGVLVCCLGRATRSVSTIMAMTKTYQAMVNLAGFSSTDDAEGTLDPVAVDTPPDALTVDRVLRQHVGEIEQRPPAHSAVKIRGRRAYQLARGGQAVDMPPRIVRIDAITLDRYDWPELAITVVCGKGTYIRSLARQIGEALGTGGHLAALRRTAIGPYTANGAWNLDALPDRLEAEHLLPVPNGESVHR
jgi:tRNA pseudouridine55 synthase